MGYSDTPCGWWGIPKRHPDSGSQLIKEFFYTLPPIVKKLKKRTYQFIRKNCKEKGDLPAKTYGFQFTSSPG